MFGPAITALSQKYVPKSAEATALALPATVGNIVFLAAPSLLGEIADKLGKFKGWDCAVAGLVFIITAVFMFLAQRPKTSNPCQLHSFNSLLTSQFPSATQVKR